MYHSVNNSRNRQVPLHVAEAWLRTYGVTDVRMTDAALTVLRKALVHRSCSLQLSRRQKLLGEEACNERLEFLGDSVLQLAVASYVFERFANQNEGFMTRLRTKLVNGDSVATFARHLGLGEWVQMSNETEDHIGRDQKGMMEDAFEAWLGSLFVSFGFDVAKRWLVNFMEKHVDFTELIVQRTDHKERVLKHFQTVHGCLPVYQVDQQGMTFTVRVLDKHGKMIASAKSGTVKKAENEASVRALKYLGLQGPYGLT